MYQSHTPWSGWPFLLCCLITNSSSEWTACCISHTPLIWLTVSFVLPNHKQFIWVNRMLCIAHTFIWLHVSFVPPQRKQLIELNRMPFIAHATKTRTVFDASVIANVLYISDGFHIAPFAIIASHTVSRRVSDRSVALAASCSSLLVAPRTLKTPPYLCEFNDSEILSFYEKGVYTTAGWC